MTLKKSVLRAFLEGSRKDGILVNMCDNNIYSIIQTNNYVLETNNSETTIAYNLGKAARNNGYDKARIFVLLSYKYSWIIHEIETQLKEKQNERRTNESQI